MFPEINIAMRTLTNEIINAAILGFEARKRQLDTQIVELRAMLAVQAKEPAAVSASGRPRRKLSAATRKAMAAILLLIPRRSLVRDSASELMSVLACSLGDMVFFLQRRSGLEWSWNSVRFLPLPTCCLDY